jgi:hypothetical protein
MFDYEGVLCKALLQPEYLNSNPSSNILGKDSLNIAHLFRETPLGNESNWLRCHRVNATVHGLALSV